MQKEYSILLTPVFSADKTISLLNHWMKNIGFKLAMYMLVLVKTPFQDQCCYQRMLSIATKRAFGHFRGLSLKKETGSLGRFDALCHTRPLPLKEKFSGLGPLKVRLNLATIQYNT